MYIYIYIYIHIGGEAVRQPRVRKEGRGPAKPKQWTYVFSFEVFSFDRFFEQHTIKQTKTDNHKQNQLDNHAHIYMYLSLSLYLSPLSLSIYIYIYMYIHISTTWGRGPVRQHLQRHRGQPRPERRRADGPAKRQKTIRHK